MLEDRLGFEILKEVSRISNSIQDLDATLNQIIEVTKNEMKIDACAIFLLDEEGLYLRFQASSGVGSERAKHIKLKMGEGITGWVAQHKTSLALRDALNDPRAYHFPQVVEEKFQSMLSVPIIFNNQCIGVINVGSCVERVFSKREISILETIANQVSGCIRNALLFQKTQKLLKEQTILYDISRAVQTTLNMEQGLWIILSGITMGEAGGFNRAILFMADETENYLEGMMGLGPDSPEDAHRIWTGIGKFEGSLLQWVIEADKDAYKRSTFNTFARSLKFPLREGNNVLADTFIQRKPFNLVDAAKDPRVSREFLELLGATAFATVPLVAHEKALGVILVDNRYNDKVIADADLRLLARFATHASWVIENTRLFTQLRQTNRDLLETKEQLSQSEKLAALGELSAEVAHEIKNPLVSIGGFARRLQDKISKFVVDEKCSVDYQTTLKYSQIILGEVERLEALLKNILLYSTTSELRKEDCPVNLLL
ncbi:MAG: GAF domain-containing protein, partial [Nitrospinales bacterium]